MVSRPVAVGDCNVLNGRDLMPYITVENGKVVVRNGRIGTGQGCCCGGCGDPCSKCNQSCISLAISGFAGSSEGPECEECDAINGTYTLVRGTGAPPTISPSIQDTSGTGAVITADLVFRPEDGGWTIGSVGVDKKGTCYTGDAKFAYTLTGAAVACDDEPVVTVEVERTEPLLTLTPADISLPAGTGAVLTPVYVPVVTTPGQETWAIESVSVTSGGVNYDNLQSVSIATKGCTKAVLNASLSIKVDVSKPTVTEAYVVPLKSSSQAAGAVVSIEWVPYDAPVFPAEGHLDGVQHWVPVGKIVSAGTGYAIGDSVNFEWPAKHFFAGGLYPTGVEFYLDNVASVGQNGQILDLDTTDAQDNWGLAAYYSDGTISSVTVADGGEYYTPGGIKSLTLVDGGTFWSTEPCRYSVCAPSGCKVNGEEQCRQISLSVGNEDNKLTISIAGSKLAEATLPAEGSSCGSLSFSAEEITSQCAKVGTITLTGTTCTSGPSQDSCCDPCTAPCDVENPCPEGCVCVNGQCVAGCCCVGGYRLPSYTTEASCEQCDEVNTCVEYVTQDCTYAFRDCTYADPDENGQCPEGFQQTGWGQCEQCAPCPEGYELDPFGYGCVQCQPCPEGFMPDGFGGCSRTTTVSDCEDCEGYCTYVETIGPCGSFSVDCTGDCLYDCCFCDGQCQQKTYMECLQCGGYPKGVVAIEDGIPLPCLERAPGGSLTTACAAEEDCCNIAPCDEECEWPEQITVDISGMPGGYGYRFQGGGNGMPLPPGAEDDLTFRVVGAASGFAGTFTGNLPQNGSYVLDRVSADCSLVEYAGVAPGWTCSSFSGLCEETQDGITVRLTRANCGVTAIGFASTFGAGAHAVVTSYDHTTGAITGVRMCRGGGGYARLSGEAVQVANVSAIVYSQHGGEGAVLEATIDSSAESATFGQITALEIADGGTGYGIGGWTISGTYASSFGQIDLLAGLDLSPGFAACQIGQELSGFEEPARERLSKEKCGVDLVAKSYSGRFSAETFPGAASAAAGVTYALGLDPVHNVCDVLEVVGITWAIS